MTTYYKPAPLPTVTALAFDATDSDLDRFCDECDARRDAAAAQIAAADAITYAEPDSLQQIIIFPIPDGYRVSYWRTRNGETFPTMHTDCPTAYKAAQELPESYQPIEAVKF